jgi:hypothetical protein
MENALSIMKVIDSRTLQLPPTPQRSSFPVVWSRTGSPAKDTRVLESAAAVKLMEQHLDLEYSSNLDSDRNISADTKCRDVQRAVNDCKWRTVS